MPRLRRNINKISLYGRSLRKENQNGHHLGEKEDPDGILSAQQWLQQCSKSILSIFIQVGLILDSLIMIMRSLKVKPTTTATNGSITSGIQVISISKEERCPRVLRISFLSEKSLTLTMPGK